MSLITRTAKGSKLTIAEMDGNLTYLEQLAKSGFKKITIPLEIQGGGTVEIEDQQTSALYYTLNEENLFFGQGIVNNFNNVLSNDSSFYEDTDGLIHIGSVANLPALPA